MYKYNIKYSINQEGEFGERVVNGSIDIDVDTLLTTQEARDCVRENYVKVIDFNELIITNI